MLPLGVPSVEGRAGALACSGLCRHVSASVAGGCVVPGQRTCRCVSEVRVGVAVGACESVASASRMRNWCGGGWQGSGECGAALRIRRPPPALAPPMFVSMCVVVAVMGVLVVAVLSALPR